MFKQLLKRRRWSAILKLGNTYWEIVHSSWLNIRRFYY